MSSSLTVVIGAGTIGLSVARSLSHLNINTLLMESNQSFGLVTSSRNSSVIHAGIYYPFGSLKQRACIHGKQQLYNYLKEKKIAYKKCGKLLVATNESEVKKLLHIKEKAELNGVDDLILLESVDVHQIEPQIACIKALYSPSTGVFDSYAFMTSIMNDISDRHDTTQIVYNCTVNRVNKKFNDLFTIDTSLGAIKCKNIINAAGLDAIRLTSLIEDYPKNNVLKQYYAKGSYFRLAVKDDDKGNTNIQPFSHLIYPIPTDGGLGIHATIDVNSSVTRFGPDVEWLLNTDTASYDHENGMKKFKESIYDVDTNRSNQFYQSINTYYPDIVKYQLIEDFAGIRTKLTCSTIGSNKNNAMAKNVLEDFYIEDWNQHQVSGLINCFGIESPGLTSSMYLGQYIVDKLILES